MHKYFLDTTFLSTLEVFPALIGVTWITENWSHSAESLEAEDTRSLNTSFF